MRGLPLLFLSLGAGLAGCHTPSADVITIQDPGYSVTRQSKLAFPAQEPTDVPSRLASEYLQQQMLQLGFNIVSDNEAEFVVRCTASLHGTTVEEPGSGVGVGVGGGYGSGGYGSGGGVFSGVGVGIPVGRRPATTLRTTVLQIMFQRVQEPRLIVWQGKISAETSDAEKYQEQFYRALLAHVGASFTKTISLDVALAPAGSGAPVAK